MPDYTAQPAVAGILKMLARPQGASAAQIAKARGLQPHTVRAVISRLASRGGIKLEKRRVAGRATVYRTVRR